MMKNYKIIVSYDGTRYKGWQRLGDSDMTIQGKLENVLSRLSGNSVEVTGSGRTDAGVHAKGQVANAHIDSDYDLAELLCLLNEHLPDDIAVLSVEEVDDRFHARFNAVEKTYSYTINTGFIPDVFNARYQYHLVGKLDIAAMRIAAGYMVGTHDFTSFCGNAHMKKSAVRTVRNIDICEEDTLITITYKGDGFLQNMIRVMTGTLIEVGRGEIAPEKVTDIIEAKDRKKAGYTVPPTGLILEQVKY